MIDNNVLNLIDIIEQLNEELFDFLLDAGHDADITRTFNYSSDGYVDLIHFGEIEIWNSEIDDREFDEDTNEYEPFLPFIKNKYNEVIEELNQFKFPDQMPEGLDFNTTEHIHSIPEVLFAMTKNITNLVALSSMNQKQIDFCQLSKIPIDVYSGLGAAAIIDSSNIEEFDDLAT